MLFCSCPQFITCSRRPEKEAAKHTEEKSSCCSTASHQQHQNIATADNISPSGQYICPMKCEGEKIYNEPGRCPVCGMFLAPIEDVNTPVKEEKLHAVLQQAISSIRI